MDYVCSNSDWRDDLANAEALDVAPQKKQGKLPLILGLVAAILIGAGGFYATYSGILFGPPDSEHSAESAEPLPDIAFVPIETLTINLPQDSASKHLRFTAQLEVSKAYVEEVTRLMPRILDVLNGYLRAVETADLENPAALVRLRAQMLRRIQIVTGENRVRDLLIAEFVVN